MHHGRDNAPPWPAQPPPLLKATTEFKAIIIYPHTTNAQIKKNQLYKHVVYWNGIQIMHG